ncbi:MAG TPA: excinuclease ABC subunit UvrC [Tepidisphaeraceae bacterium]|jgi:excinuclease ABC subunit C
MEDRETRLKRLLEKASRLTRDPGVYLMKDKEGRVIYIGKSAFLRDRVSSYFQPSTKLDFKKAPMLDIVDDFDILGTETEVEALLMENRLIKDVQPRFNARLLDDKTFPYLEVTMDTDYPGVYVTREPQQRGTKLFGPFTSVYQLKEAVTHLQKAFKFRTCHLDIREDDSKKRFFRPCLLHAINQCTAPCADKIGREQYADDIRKLNRFLDGERKGILAELEREMREASKNMQFEKAAKVRDELKALQALSKRAGKGEQEFWQPEAFVHNPQEGVVALQEALNLPEPPRIVEGFDIAHLQGGEMVGSMVCFIDGVPFKNAYRRYKIQHGQGNNDFLSLQEVVSRRYREAGEQHELFPNLIMIDGGIGQLHAAMDAFRIMDVKPPAVISLAKKEELIYTTESSEPIRLPRNHLGLKLLQYLRDEAHRFAQHYHHILRRKAQLEQDVKAGKRPPKKRVSRPKLVDEVTAQFSTIASLPILKPQPTPTPVVDEDSQIDPNEPA